MPYAKSAVQRRADHKLQLKIYEHLHTRHRIPWKNITAFASLSGIKRVHSVEHLDHPLLRHNVHAL